MKIVILGAGLMGVTTAYFLAKQGHEVIVLEQEEQPAMGASFANGGQISVCYSEPWSSFENVLKIAKWIGKDDAPILLHPKFEFKQMAWGAQFLAECLPFRNHQNIKKMLELALFSRGVLGDLRDELDLRYEQQTNGILTFYTSVAGFNHGKAAADFMRQFGCERVVKSKEEALKIEPTLSGSELPIFGADYSEEDESGNAFLFVQEMTRHCRALGVQFRFNTKVSAVEPGAGRRFQIQTNHDGWSEITTDNLVVCLGVHTYDLMQNFGLYVPIYPAKGYSATIPVLDDALVNKVSLTDLDYKIVLTRLGRSLRVAGTAEFNGYDTSLNQARCDALIARTQKLYPSGLDYTNVKFWAGLRPATPGNVPLIGKTKIDGLYINAGHGTLGWTMACGSAKRIAEHFAD